MQPLKFYSIVDCRIADMFLVICDLQSLQSFLGLLRNSFMQFIFGSCCKIGVVQQTLQFISLPC
jgi:hypothetical protein